MRMPKTKIVYRIRRKSDGLFSAGGYSPRFTVKGKVWNSKNALHNHLHLEPKSYATTYTPGPFGGYQYATHDAYADCEVVEYEISETETGAVSMNSYRDAKRKADDAKKDKTRSRIQKCPSCNQPLNTHLCDTKVLVKVK